MTNYCRIHCEYNSTLFFPLKKKKIPQCKQETQICQKSDGGKVKQKIAGYLETKHIDMLGSWTFLYKFYFCSNINFKVCDMLLCFLKIITYLFWTAVSFIWGAFKFAMARTRHYFFSPPSPLSLSLTLCACHFQYSRNLFFSDRWEQLFIHPQFLLIRFVFSQITLLLSWPKSMMISAINHAERHQ